MANWISDYKSKDCVRPPTMLYVPCFTIWCYLVCLCSNVFVYWSMEFWERIERVCIVKVISNIWWMPLFSECRIFSLRCSPVWIYYRLISGSMKHFNSKFQRLFHFLTKLIYQKSMKSIWYLEIQKWVHACTWS